MKLLPALLATFLAYGVARSSNATTRTVMDSKGRPHEVPIAQVSPSAQAQGGSMDSKGRYHHRPAKIELQAPSRSDVTYDSKGRPHPRQSVQ
jgi:hypothetical protein